MKKDVRAILQQIPSLSSHQHETVNKQVCISYIDTLSPPFDSFFAQHWNSRASSVPFAAPSVCPASDSPSCPPHYLFVTTGFIEMLSLAVHPLHAALPHAHTDQPPTLKKIFYAYFGHTPMKSKCLDFIINFSLYIYIYNMYIISIYTFIMNTHTHIHICIYVYVYLYIYILIFRFQIDLLWGKTSVIHVYFSGDTADLLWYIFHLVFIIHTCSTRICAEKVWWFHVVSLLCLCIHNFLRFVFCLFLARKKVFNAFFKF